MTISVNPSTGRVSAYPTYAPSPPNAEVRSPSDASGVGREALLALTRLVKTLDGIERNLSSAGPTGRGDRESLVGPRHRAVHRSADGDDAPFDGRHQHVPHLVRAPRNPDWQGLSSSNIALHGTYDGSNGSGTLGFVVTQGGLRGTSTLEVDVELPNGGGTERVSVQRTDPTSTVYALSNGLGVSFGGGILTAGDRADATVTLSTTESVRPDKPFDGTGDDGPHFENGHVVSNGSFEVNGVTIAVSGTDTIDGVLSRIDGSTAGVTAAFDAATETVLLTQRSAGSAHDIVLANDTSGFLAATKLVDATATAGRDHQPDASFSRVPAFGEVRSGTFRIDGSDIPIDVERDSLNGTLERLNDGPASVSAALIGGLQRVSLSTDDASGALSLSSGATGFFPAIGIADGEYVLDAEPSVSVADRRRSYRAADLLEAFGDDLADAYRLTKESSASGASRLEASFGAVVERYTDRHGSARLRSLGLEFGDLGDGLFSPTTASRRRFTLALQNGERLERVLLGNGGSDSGLLEALRDVVKDFAAANQRHHGRGRIVDRFA